MANNHIPVSVYDTLINVTNKHLPLLHRYVALRKKLLNLDEVHMYDLYTPITGEPTLKYTYDEAKEEALKALAVLGDDYLSHVKEAFDNRWIDVVANQGKRGGAYSGGSYDTARTFCSIGRIRLIICLRLYMKWDIRFTATILVIINLINTGIIRFLLLKLLQRQTKTY